MKDMQMDKTELGCLRAIVLFNPGQFNILLFYYDSDFRFVAVSVFYLDWLFVCFVFFADAKGLSNPSEVEGLREKVYASLESYTKQKYPDQPGR